jgi:UPF0755 protein
MRFMRRIFLVLLIALLVAAAGAAGAAWWTDRYVHTALPLQESLTFEVPSGGNLRTVSRELAARGVLEHPALWVWYARFKGRAHSIHAGEYQIDPGVTPAGVLERLVRGEVILRAVTFVEGSTYRDMLATLAAEPRLRQTVQDLTDEALMEQLGSPGVAPEGQFFPDTYRFAAGTADLEILRRAHDEMRRRLGQAWAGRAPDLPLETPHEALILASIVEKETALASERPRIAGVFVRRLRVGMRLQSDPTVIYGLGVAYDGDIRTRDLRGDTPFNTYTRNGLPPTPIALPGGESLQAVVRPLDSGALYFVATGEPDGSHYFSATLEEHNAAVRRYLERTRGGRR